MKKKSLIFFTLALALSLCLAFVSCGDKSGGINKLTAESGVTANGAFEKDSALKAECYSADSERGKVAVSAIDKPYDGAKVAVFDITLTKGGKKVQPSGKVRITMPKPFEADVYVTYHIKGDNTAEELETAIDGNNISFETTSFSYFVVTTEKVAHRTKLNYKGVWYQSLQGEPVDETYSFQNDPYMIEKRATRLRLRTPPTKTRH